MRYYPIAFNLNNRKVLIVGAGAVAERKIEKLLGLGARITVVAPIATAAIWRLWRARKLIWLPRHMKRSDLAKTYLVIAATDEVSVNKKVSRWARHMKVLVNVVDNPGLSDFISPAVIRNKRALIAVYTDGIDPVLSRDVKNFLQEHWDAFILYRRRLQKRRT